MTEFERDVVESAIHERRAEVRHAALRLGVIIGGDVESAERDELLAARARRIAVDNLVKARKA